MAVPAVSETAAFAALELLDKFNLLLMVHASLSTT
jgi:hypothetical protein